MSSIFRHLRNLPITLSFGMLLSFQIFQAIAMRPRPWSLAKMCAILTLMENLSRREIEFIEAAAKFLEKPGFLIRAANAVGKPLELAQKALPQKVQEKISAAVQKSLQKTLDISIA